jgi:hypothetical protein
MKCRNHFLLLAGWGTLILTCNIFQICDDNDPHYSVTEKIVYNVINICYLSVFVFYIACHQTKI